MKFTLAPTLFAFIAPFISQAFDCPIGGRAPIGQIELFAGRVEIPSSCPDSEIMVYEMLNGPDGSQSSLPRCVSLSDGVKIETSGLYHVCLQTDGNHYKVTQVEPTPTGK